MKLLFDQNLSLKLPGRFSDLFPNSEHVINLGLDQSPDDQIWDYAKANAFAIVTKDEDFPPISSRYEGTRQKLSGCSSVIARLGKLWTLSDRIIPRSRPLRTIRRLERSRFSRSLGILGLFGD